MKSWKILSGNFERDNPSAAFPEAKGIPKFVKSSTELNPFDLKNFAASTPVPDPEAILAKAPLIFASSAVLATM